MYKLDCRRIALFISLFAIRESIASKGQRTIKLDNGQLLQSIC